MYGREELKTYISCELYDKSSDEFKAGDAYLKEDANKVMDAMESRIKELEVVISKMETTAPKWVSTKDRFPCEDGEYQVVYQHKNGANVASVDEWDNDCQDWMNATDRVNVIYWADLLPPPPTTEDSSSIGKE